MVYNWKPLVNYVVNKTKGGLRLKKELALTLVLSTAIVVSAVFELPPLIYIADLSEHIKDSWVTDKEYEPPIGHAELLPLDEFTKKMKINQEKALVELEKNGIRVESPDETVGEIAENNDTSPLLIYKIIKKYESKNNVFK